MSEIRNLWLFFSKLTEVTCSSQAFLHTVRIQISDLPGNNLGSETFVCETCSGLIVNNWDIYISTFSSLYFCSLWILKTYIVFLISHAFIYTSASLPEKQNIPCSCQCHWCMSTHAGSIPPVAAAEGSGSDESVWTPSRAASACGTVQFPSRVFGLLQIHFQKC